MKGGGHVTISLQARRSEKPWSVISFSTAA